MVCTKLDFGPLCPQKEEFADIVCHNTSYWPGTVYSSSTLSHDEFTKGNKKSVVLKISDMEQSSGRVGVGEAVYQFCTQLGS